ncbi:hypothetical protein PHYSODRAFT_329103 [Phytophthora sojae]|uniref:Uncharacterized protein n=1 Tax=Phytophthora sojae (strain P6497) TaxID=1094619 RepID=G4Z7N0_PHYSP|nr:hypothetical protein PHYSODRAFT_329103 [Phytophthora sojae]EGZ21069.1 hypothetical protein PHYSODRAFT_329103 [Phytophthora sojae]|eukprot:XP_009523786.1 hypothetical protein PHYSODRAFT_329103 [Phytophthora sojae]
MTLCSLLLTLVVAIVSVVVLFSVALVPETKVQEDTGVNAWLSWLPVAMMVLVEIFVVTLINSLVTMGCYQVNIFDQVTVARGFEDMLQDGSWFPSLRLCWAETTKAMSFGDVFGMALEFESFVLLRSASHLPKLTMIRRAFCASSNSASSPHLGRHNLEMSSEK